MEKQTLSIDPRHILVGYEPIAKMVFVKFPLPPDQTGFADGTTLGFHISPTEARLLAQLLIDKSDLAESGSFRH